jgi:hypothetical protein
MPRTFGQMRGQGQDVVGWAGAAPAPARPTPTVTQAAGGVINLAARPVRWAFDTTGSVIQWLGGTLRNIGQKL